MGFLLEDVIHIRIPGQKRRKSLSEIFAKVDDNIATAQRLNRQVKATIDGESRWFTCEEVDKNGNPVV